jgi:putative glutamine amidotransferase
MESSNKKIRIGLTYTEARYENYAPWIKGNDENIEIVELHWEKHDLDEVWDEVEDCDGIVLSGGIDVEPDYYENDRHNYPNAPAGFNKHRDEFEMHVLETALNFDLPVLAICRGLQLVNVALGGNLIQDLEENKQNDHQRHNDVDGRHDVKIVEGSLLSQIAGSTTGTVNSAHHQGLGQIAEELMVNSYSPDNVVEGVEWKTKTGKPFLLAVQWHPERMDDRETNPLSKNIRAKFLEVVRNNG